MNDNILTALCVTIFDIKPSEVTDKMRDSITQFIDDKWLAMQEELRPFKESEDVL